MQCSANLLAKFGQFTGKVPKSILFGSAEPWEMAVIVSLERLIAIADFSQPILGLLMDGPLSRLSIIEVNCKVASVFSNFPNPVPQSGKSGGRCGIVTSPF